ncbi:MAG TPA: DUF3631 domain-containing protein [Propionibacteriaceae bacterium]|nr:DUF3631 domain-containing protein [Propionibacteriaceae bacterium]
MPAAYFEGFVAGSFAVLRRWESVLLGWPEMPAGVDDRSADLWEPMLAIAELAGGDWPQRHRGPGQRAVLPRLRLTTPQPQAARPRRLRSLGS